MNPYLTIITSNHRYNDAHFLVRHGIAITLEEKPYVLAGWEDVSPKAEEVYRIQNIWDYSCHQKNKAMNGFPWSYISLITL